MLKLSPKLLTKLFVVCSLLSAFSVVYGASRTEQKAKAKDVAELWISRSWGDGYDAISIINNFQNLKRVYVPLFQFAPTPLIDLRKSPDAYFANSEGIEAFRKKGIEVYGIFSPLQISLPDQVDRNLQELTLAQAFADKPVAKSLEIIGDRPKEIYRKWAKLCVENAHVDGLVLDMTLPNDQLYGYSEATRNYYVSRFHFDPLDISYPLGIPDSVPLKENSFVEILVKDRLDQMALLVRSIVDICAEAKKRVAVFSLASSYDFAASTRAASLTDWGRWALENPSLRVLLASMEDPLTPDQRIDKVGSYLAALKIDRSRVTYIARSPETLELITATTDGSKVTHQGLQLGVFWSRTGK